MSKFSSVNAPEPINASVPFVQTMHGDTSNSDSSPLSGPDLSAASFDARFHEQKATFPTLLRRSDGHVMALATSFALADNYQDDGTLVQAQVFLIDGDTGHVMGTPQDVHQVSMMGGVYAYLNQRDVSGGQPTDSLIVTSATQPVADETPTTTIVSFTASHDEHHRLALNPADTLADISDHLYPSQELPIAASRPQNEQGIKNDAVVSLSPDQDGDIWFASAQGKVGICQLGNGSDPIIQSIPLGMGETINNSFSTTTHSTLGQVAAVTTNSKLHLIVKDAATGAPVHLWSQTYDAGDAWKPGQLQYPPSFFETPETDQCFGTGATPTFFGPETGAEWVVITDNATDALNLQVFDVATGAVIAETPLFTQGNPAFQDGAKGTENSVMAYGNSIIIPSTNGFPYPVPPMFDHTEHPFVGGITRFDIETADGVTYDAEHKWTWYHRSSAVPKYAINDGLIYTILRTTDGQNDSNPESRAAMLQDTFSVAAISYETGEVVAEKPLTMAPHLPATHTKLHALGNPVQMACCFTVDSGDAPVMWQGTFSGYYRISS